MGFDSEQKKLPYSPPNMTKLTPEQVKQRVADASSSEQEAEALLESLRRGEKPKEE